MYEEEKKSPLGKIIIAVLTVLLLVALVLLFIFFQKAGTKQDEIDGIVATAVGVKEKELQAACEVQKKEIQENPWEEFAARDVFGAFKFQIPRSWARYERFDLDANVPLALYFNPSLVRYDSLTNSNHAALYIEITKTMYSKEIDNFRNKMKGIVSAEGEELDASISGFDGKVFYYKDKDLGKKIAVVILPYRDRTLMIRTDDYNNYQDYFKKFSDSFVLTR